MKHKYLAFDIETAKILPDDHSDLHAYRPLGISCAAIWATDKEEAELFYSHDADGNTAGRMTADDLSEMVDLLLDRQKSGYTILTHNGLSFDFDILAEESSRTADCKTLTLGHVDMMFHIFCGKGFGVGLNAAAQAIGQSKPEGVEGSQAPLLWKQGAHQKVLDYVAQDCRLTLNVAEKSAQQNSFRWITRRGKKASFNLPRGWLTVEEAMNLPLPDTSWMDNPWSRSKLSGWLNA
jgi:hypothetical protein